MRPECIKIINESAGRELTKRELDGIENRIRSEFKKMSVEDNKRFMSMSEAERYQEAAKRAAEAAVADTVRLKQLAIDNIAKQAANKDYIDRYKPGRKLEAVGRLLWFDRDRQSGVVSAESASNAYYREWMGDIAKVFSNNKAGVRTLWGLLGTPKGAEQFVRARFGEQVSPEAKKAYELFKDANDRRVQMYNALGGYIDALEDWGFPQKANPILVLKKAKTADEFVALMRKNVRLDRRRYINDDGSMMDDAGLNKLLSKVWETYVTDGANRAGGDGQGMRALGNRNNYERVLHFADADSYLWYMNTFSGNDMNSTIAAHVRDLSNKMAFVERFGTNADLNFEKLIEDAKAEDAKAAKTLKDQARARITDWRLRSAYEYTLYGSQVGSATLAANFQTLRNLKTAAIGGSYGLAAFQDLTALGMTAKLNNIPVITAYREFLSNFLSTFTKNERFELLQEAGLALNFVAADNRRFADDMILNNASSVLADAVMHAGGLNHVDFSTKTAAGKVVLTRLARMADKYESVSQMHPSDQAILADKGVTDTDLAIWRLAEKIDLDGVPFLTAKQIRAIPDEAVAKYGNPLLVKNAAAVKLMATAFDEGLLASPTATLQDRTMLGQTQFKRGTWIGEIGRSVMMLKSTPLAAIKGQLVDRPSGMGGVTPKAKYIAAYMAGSMVMAAAMTQVYATLAGKDPMSVDPTEKEGRYFWIQALARAGFLAFYSDVVFQTSSQAAGNTSVAGALAGPLIGGLLDDTANVLKNVPDAVVGEKTNLAGDAANLALGNFLPFKNVWYTRAITDHLLLQQLQEELSPGRNARMQQRAAKYGNTYWWRPGATEPDRGPDFGKVFGQ